MLVNHSPDCCVHAAVIELFVVQLSEEREQDLDASYRVNCAVDGVGNNGLHILRGENGMLALTETRFVPYVHTDAETKSLTHSQLLEILQPSNADVEQSNTSNII